ncbi:MAG TPA: hypothetical protein VF665_16335 [Longimicrobium sp.]|jgi:hypothetical protein|uniref:hypothetical protein n=1 Tax=Longimicrobium sp. TaxID=2029185 RepID=UPI002EDA9894
MVNFRYAVARYMPDLFRQEPRNIGVFVVSDSHIAFRLVGQKRDDGELDLRKVRSVQRDGSVYSEWFAHWTELVERLNRSHYFPSVFADRAISALVAASGNMFTIRDGGLYVPQADALTVEDVADILFQKVVSAEMIGHGLTDDDDEPEAQPGTLYGSVLATFREYKLLTRKAEPTTPLIRVRAPVLSTLGAPHRPKFSQLNSKLVVMQDVDFRRGSEESVRDHALSTAYMFADIQSANGAAQPVEVIAIVSFAEDRNFDAQNAGKVALSRVPGARMVDWTDSFDRERFVRERLAVAASHN